MKLRSGLSSIDLFSGAGGFSVSLEQAGFETVAALDNNPDAIESLRRNKAAGLGIPETQDRTYLQKATLLEADIGEISASDLRPIGVGGRWRPDLLAGGPPCQPFSSAGRQKGLSDPRGHLFLEFVRLTSELRPRYVLFENVRGLLTQKGPDGIPGGVLELVQRSFEEVGYAVRFAVLNSADLGASQRRVRLYMIGTADHELVEFPCPTHSKDPAFDGLKPWVSLGELLSAMPDPADDEIVWPSGKRAGELKKLSPGTGLKTGGVIEFQRPSGHWGYRQDSFLADLCLPSRTIRAASTPDWVRLPGRPMRRLTVRECAALQGFPPQWTFSGTKASAFRQVGNAVNIDAGTAIAHEIAAGLNAGPLRGRSPESAPWPPTFKRRIDYTAMEARVNGPSRTAGRRAS